METIEIQELRRLIFNMQEYLNSDDFVDKMAQKLKRRSET